MGSEHISKHMAVWVALVAAGGALVVGLLAYEVPLSPGGDPSDYLVLARSLRLGHGYRMISEPGEPPETKRPPGYPGFLAAWMTLFGDSLLALKASSLVCFSTAAALVCVFALRRGRMGLWSVIAVCLLFVVNLWSLQYATEIYSEMLFTVLGLLIVLLADVSATQQRMPYWAAAVLGALVAGATYVRPTGVTLIPAIVLCLLVQRHWRQAAITGIVCVALLAPWGIIEVKAASSGKHTYLAAVERESRSPGSSSPFVTYAQRTLKRLPGRSIGLSHVLFARPHHLSLKARPRHVPSPAAASAESPGQVYQESSPRRGLAAQIKLLGRHLVSLLAIAGLIVTWRRKPSAAHWYTLCTALMICLAPYETMRYWYPLLPFLAWFVVEIVYEGASVAVGWTTKHWAERFGLAAVAMLCTLYGIVGAVSIAQSLDAKLQTRGLPWWAPERYEFAGSDIANYVRTALWIRDRTPLDAIIVCRKPSFLYAVCGRRATCLLWSAPETLWKQANELLRLGPVYFIQDGFGTRYNNEDSSTRNLVPALAAHRSEVTEEYRLTEPTTVLWRLTPNSTATDSTNAHSDGQP